MILRDKLNIMEETTIKDNEGYNLITWVDGSVTIDCEYMHSSGKIDLREYGITDVTRAALVFVKNNTLLKENSRVKITTTIQDINAKRFVIKVIKPYKTHYELILEGEKNG